MKNEEQGDDDDNMKTIYIGLARESQMVERESTFPVMGVLYICMDFVLGEEEAGKVMEEASARSETDGEVSSSDATKC